MGELACRFCGKNDFHGKTEQSKRGALNLHEYHCELKQLKKTALEEKKVEEKEKKEKGCKHEWRLLKGNNPIELRAIQAGYKEVCDKCQDIR